MPENQSYSLKEVVDLTRQEQATGFNRIEILLASKADKADLGPINRRLDVHDGQIRTLQDTALAEANGAAAREKRIMNIKWGVGASMLIVATILGAILAHVFP